MNIATLLVFLAIGWINLQVYTHHRKRRNCVASAPRPFHPMSRVTRLFRPIQHCSRFLVVLHLVLQACYFNPQGPSVGMLLVGVSVSLVGLILLHLSLAALGTQFSPCHRARVPSERVRRGPYAWISHPIYLANVLVLAGMAIADCGPVILIVLALIGTVYAFAIRDENRTLNDVFPDVAR